MVKRAPLLLLLIICCVQMNSYAQSSSIDISPSLIRGEFQARRVVPPSPDAASLGKFGNVPVSLFTGAPQIYLPLFELKSGSIDVPLSLSYNASGFKPEEIASWVGLNWNLNAGGVITRSVIGNPDIVPYYFSNTNNYETLFAQTDLIAKNDAFLKLKQGYMEAQPDVYYYNFAGKTGKFIIKPDGTIIKKQKDNLKISHCITCFDPNTDGSSYFNITDENGNLFEFRDAEVSTLQYDPNLLPVQAGEYPGITFYTYPSSWYLSKITSADGNSVLQFEYYTSSSPHIIYNNYLNYQSITYYTSTQPSGFVDPTSDPSCPEVICGSTNPGDVLDQFSYGTSPAVSFYQKYLKSIKLLVQGSASTVVDFVSTIDQRQDLDHNFFAGERMLTTVKISRVNENSTTNTIKQYNLSQSYFTGALNIPDNKRLRLDQLQEIPQDANTPSPPPYVFTYNNNGLTPSISSAGKDHWGFYNGEANLSGGFGAVLIPNVAPGRGLGANRNANDASTLNILTKLTYPTGGYSTFEYDVNDATLNNLLTPVGGLRIKTITDYSFVNKKATQKNYYYTLEDGVSSSGNAFMPIYTSTSSYHHYPGFLAMQTCNGNPELVCSEAIDWDKNYFTVSASPVSGLGTIQGSHIGYSLVTEIQSDVSTGAGLGKTIYRYNIGNMTGGNDDDVSAGDLLETSVYDNKGKLLKNIVNAYNYLPFQSWVAANIRPNLSQDNRTIFCQYNNGGQIDYKWYGVWQTFSDCIQTRTIVSRQNLYGYFFNGMEKQLVTQTEKVFDQSNGNYLVTTRNFSYGNPAHTYPTLVEESTSNSEILGTVTRYAGDYTIPATGNTDDVSQGIKLLQNKNMLGAEIEKIQYRKKQNGTNQRYLNGQVTTYNTLFPFPKDVFRIETVSPLSSVQNSAVNTSGIFTKDPAYKPLGHFEFAYNGNLLEQTKTNDLTKANIWSEKFSMPVAEVINANSSSIAYTSFENSLESGYWNVGNGTSANYVPGGFTGTQSFMFTSGVTILRRQLLSTPQYIVSYWSKNGPVTITTDNGGGTSKTGIARGIWTYYEHLLPTGIQTVSLSGPGINIDELRLFPSDAQMTTYTFTPLIGTTSVCSPANQVTYYDYDGLNRLVNIKNNDGDIIKNYKYNYGLGSPLTPSATSLFANAVVQLSFTKNDGCPQGAIPTSVIYSVPSAKYISSVSQQDADNKAWNEINSNGQANANANGQCLYYSVVRNVPFYKNDCAPSMGNGLQYIYTVPAGKYSSPVSQAAANAMAQAEIDAYGQSTANINAGCSCASEGYKQINGSCEQGSKIITGSITVGTGQYRCVYHYLFSDQTITADYLGPITTTSCPIQ